MTTLRISQFNVTRSRIEAGGAYFRSKIFGPLANSVCVAFQNGILMVSIMPLLPDWVKKYDGVSKIEYDGQQIFINEIPVSLGNELKTQQNRMIFPQATVIQPILEEYQIAEIQESIDGVPTTGYSLLDARLKLESSNLVSMPVRSTDINATGADTAFITSFERVFLKGGAGLPVNALQCDTGPFKTLVKVSGREDSTGLIQSVDEIYEWVGEFKISGYWTPRKN